MYDDLHPAFTKLQEIGKEITNNVKPKAVVVFSAHWQGEREGRIEINTALETDLIYEWGQSYATGDDNYPNTGSEEIASQVMEAVRAFDIDVMPVRRGLDHGVWASFKVGKENGIHSFIARVMEVTPLAAFDPKVNPLNVPIVQVSLFSSEDPHQHYRLGQAVSQLRSKNILIIVSGMAVHNLRDMQMSFGNPEPLPYTTAFDEALKKAVESHPSKRENEMANLLKRRDARQAHPSFEHLLPIFVGAGAAGDDVGKRLWTTKEGSVSWAQYRFGDVAS
ncbi:MAG: hypothetical protein Q9220_000034 [cf. Caloplaca sp. 1 TL-2023]